MAASPVGVVSGRTSRHVAVAGENRGSLVSLPSSVDRFSASEREWFLGMVQESLAIRRHFQLFLWLQGEVQRLLPHDVLIAVEGDFGAHRISIDLVASLPGLHAIGCRSCRHELVSARLFERWLACGRRMLAFAGGVGSLINETCDCPAAAALRGMRSALVHGLRDERSGRDTLYLMLGNHPYGDERRQARFAMLLPQIDFAWRRIAPDRLPAGGSHTAAAVKPRDDAGISAREQEILAWVRAGKTNHEIGQILNISTFTVKNHLQRIYRKIDVINRAQAVAKLEEFSRER